MIKIHIGSSERDILQVTEHWIRQQINRRRADNVDLCVRVNIHDVNRHMVLSTPSCPGCSGDRFPNRYEKQIFNLWEKCGLNKDTFLAGNLIAFLRQIRN